LENLKGRDDLGDPGAEEDHIKMNVKKIVCKGAAWIQLLQKKAQTRAAVKKVTRRMLQ
jgi:hypothetical protein